MAALLHYPNNLLEALEISAREGCAYAATSKGKFTLIDEEDLDLVSEYSLYHRSGYVLCYRCVGFKRYEKPSLHRLVMRAITGDEIDHIHGMTMDNRKSELRFCTRSQNKQNSSKKKPNAHSKYKGVTKKIDKNYTKSWMAQGMVQGKAFKLGMFATELEAAKAYNNWAVKHCGEWARLNVL